MAEYAKRETPALGYGNMRIPMNEDGTINYDLTFAMVDAYMASGYNYYDTSRAYGMSEEVLRKALVERYPRDAFELTTKTNLFMCKTEGDMRDQFKTSLETLGLDYVDTYFIHALSEHCYDKVEEFKAFDFLRELKEKGLTKHIGISFHGTPELLEKVLTENPDLELIQLQINYLDWEDEKIRGREQYEIALKHNKLISVMEPCKGGWIAGEKAAASQILKNANPDVSVASWAMRFAAELKNIYVVLSGASNVEQIEDNVKTLKNLVPLSDEEHALIDKVIETFRAIPIVPCTTCNYCRKACPKDLQISRLLDTYNNLIVFEAEESSRYIYEMMFEKVEQRASACVGCGMCVEQCPQKIDIPKYLKSLAEMLEN